MKSLIAVIAAFQEDRKSRANLKTLLRLLGLMAVLVLVYSVLFHVLMVHEGQKHSWLTGVYWTFTVMTTLGYAGILLGPALIGWVSGALGLRVAFGLLALSSTPALHGFGLTLLLGIGLVWLLSPCFRLVAGDAR